MKSKFFIILGNQLFSPTILKELRCNEVFMSEDYGLCTYFKHHKLKLYLFLTSMREYKDELENNSIKVNYFNLKDRNDNLSYPKFLTNFLKEKNIKTIHMFEIEDKDFETSLLNQLAKNEIEVIVHKSPMFIFDREEFVPMAKGKKTYRMSSYYQNARKKLNILVEENNKPFGGKWSFDEENRKKIPKNTEIPKNIVFKLSKHHISVSEIINKNFSNHPGTLENIWFPVTRKSAEEQLNNFFKLKFEFFGTFEDSLLSEQNFLFHSAISPALNVGLLTPLLVTNKALEYGMKFSIPINSLEGFIRQIIGWREFIRGIYHEEGQFQYNQNFWNNNRKLTTSWYTGTTGILPLDDCIKLTIKDGYIHHIPRLMVICNIMNLSGVHPKEIYKWFMEMYIDSSDWVMVPNVFGMATFADGGLMSTKPYTCSSNYILKMSNYKRGSWCDIMDGLYWSFVDKNKEFYKSNPRLSMQYKLLENLDSERKMNIFQEANNFIEKNTKV